MKIETTMEKNLQKRTQKYGSVLEAYRSQNGWGLGIYALGIMLIIVGVILGALLALVNPKAGMIFGAVFAVLGILLALLGKSKHNKRVGNYLEYFQKETGYTEAEIQEADRELMSPNAMMLTCRLMDNGGKQTVVIMTEHYFLCARPIEGAYLLKWEDIVASFCSNEIPGINGYRRNLFIISRQDIEKEGVRNEYTKKQYRGYEYSFIRNEDGYLEVYSRILNEITRRVPNVITSQYIAVKGVRYNLLSMDNWRADWARIMEE